MNDHHFIVGPLLLCNLLWPPTACSHLLGERGTPGPLALVPMEPDNASQTGEVFETCDHGL